MQLTYVVVDDLVAQACKVAMSQVQRTLTLQHNAQGLGGHQKHPGHHVHVQQKQLHGLQGAQQHEDLLEEHSRGSAEYLHCLNRGDDQSEVKFQAV